MKKSRRPYTCAAFFTIILLFSLSLSAQEITLQFKENKQFKIAQFTDTHFFKGGARSPEVLENMRAVLDEEKPDLIVLTGDIITGNRKNWPTMESWEILTDLLIQYKIPYAVTFGNHDDEAQVSRQELLEYL